MKWLNEYLHDVKGVPFEELADALEYLDEYADEVMVDEIIGQRRWETDKRLVLRFGDRFVEMNYSVGSTEMQDSDSDVELSEVFPHKIETTIYK